MEEDQGQGGRHRAARTRGTLLQLVQILGWGETKKAGSSPYPFWRSTTCKAAKKGLSLILCVSLYPVTSHRETTSGYKTGKGGLHSGVVTQLSEGTGTMKACNEDNREGKGVD